MDLVFAAVIKGYNAGKCSLSQLYKALYISLSLVFTLNNIRFSVWCAQINKMRKYHRPKAFPIHRSILNGYVFDNVNSIFHAF